MPKPGYVEYGGVEVILRRDNREAVPVGADWVSDHHHPGAAGRLTRWDLGELPPQMSCTVICPNEATYTAFMGVRRSAQSFTGADAHLDGQWSMTVEGATSLGGAYHVQATFTKVG